MRMDGIQFKHYMSVKSVNATSDIKMLDAISLSFYLLKSLFYSLTYTHTRTHARTNSLLPVDLWVVGIVKLLQNNTVPVTSVLNYLFCFGDSAVNSFVCWGQY